MSRVKKDIFMDFFKKIREIREKLGLNQKDFAKLLNSTQVTISRYEQNERIPDLKFIIELIEECNINPTWLFLGIGDITLTCPCPSLNSNLLCQLYEMTAMFSEERLKNIFEKTIMDELLSRFEKQEETLILKLLSLFHLDNPIRTRPYLFLYYIFQIIATSADEEKNINSYKSYIIEKISNFKVVSLKNKPLFTEGIKNEIKDFFEYKFNEKECEFLVKNSHHTLEQLEKTMPISMIKVHRNMFSKI